MRRFAYWHELLLCCLIVAVMIVAGLLEPAFVRVATQVELSTHVWEMALVALPMTWIIITAGIDLSVGSTMALCAIVLGMGYERQMSLWAASLLALLVGMGAGLLNGWFIATIRVHPLIVTLATLSAYRGLAEGISQARPISGFPDSFALLSNGHFLGLPVPAVIFATLLVVSGVVLAKTAFGRSLYAMGYNETACRFSGLAIGRIKLVLYGLSGLAAGVAAVLFVARRNTAKADIAESMALDVITAVVLGGTSIFGGRGTIIGTLLGVLLIHEMREFVSWRWHNDELNAIVIGTMLIGSVLIHSLLSKTHRETGRS